jgi:formamidopyrimidine-DNA glycosylase
MPELPEVETVKNILLPLIKNKTIDDVEVYFDRLVLSNLDDFKTKLQGQTIIDLKRYGKYLFFFLTNDLVLINHLRMEGKWRYIDKNSAKRNKYTTALFDFKDGTSLAFDDTRKFGIMYLSTIDKYKNLEMIKKLGVEPFEITPNMYSEIKEKLNKNKCIKELLLDQTIFCGIGNIYADEINYASNISPFKKGKDLTLDEVQKICINAKKILKDAIKCGGSTIHSFHPSEGVDGRMQGHLKCYGKEGQVCPICGTKFHKTFINGRGTTYCPNCQIDPSIKKAIGITGPIGSGKSTVLKYLKRKGYVVVSCDELVHELYKIPYISVKVSKILGAPFAIENKEITRNARQIMISDIDKKTRVEDFIYPILESRLIELIKENEKIAIETPLLFKAHFEFMFKKIIVLKLSDEKQIENLKNRGDDVYAAKLLNFDYSYKNIDSICIIENNSTLENLYKKINEVL